MSSSPDVGTEIEQAVAVLRAGGLVAFPTETVYGLGADAANPVAMRRLYDVKGRPAEHPVIVHLALEASIDDWAIDISAHARILAATYWPGPLTVIVHAGPRVSRIATGGLETVGLRVPAHPVAQDLLRGFTGGIAAPSANRFGRVSPTTAAAVRQDVGDDVDLVLDGGSCTVGVESTIVDCTSTVPRILRPGAITAAAIAATVGRMPEIGGGTRAPGTLPSHYAPDALVELVAADALATGVRDRVLAGDRVGVLGLARDVQGIDPSISAVTLATIADVDEYAQLLYSALRRADELGMNVVLAVAPTSEGVGAAVADRLGRAAGAR